MSTQKYFYGNEISEYGLKNGYVDLAALAKSFDAVLNNGIMSTTAGIGYWESITPDYYYSDIDGNEYTQEEAQEKIEELQEKIEELENEELEDTEKIEELQEQIDELEIEHFHDIFQYYIVSDNGAEILKEAGEILFYNDTLDMYVWGVTHYGTNWEYVLTNISLKTW